MIRRLDASETDLLEFATLENMNWWGDRITLVDVRSKPEYSHYTRILTERGDFGVVADFEGKAAAVACVALPPNSDAGYGFVDEQTSEVSLWVSAEHRERGLGRQLLRALAEEVTARGLKQISPSVEADNHAKKLHASEWYVDVAGGEATVSCCSHCSRYPHGQRTSHRPLDKENFKQRPFRLRKLSFMLDK